MDRATAMLELAVSHAVALRMRDAGIDDVTVAAALAIPEASVPTLVAIAEAKLAAVMAEVDRRG